MGDLPPPDAATRAQISAALSAFAPTGALGELALWLCGWSRGRLVTRPLFAFYVATYAHTLDGPARARARLDSLAQGAGAVSALARSLGAGVEAFDLALDRPVRQPTDGAPMSAREAAATFAFGMEALAKGPDLLVLSDVVEGGGEIASAFIERLDAPGADDALDRLAKGAGREVSALAGAILAARIQGVPVVLESAAALAAAAALARGRPGALDHCVAATASPLQAQLGLLAVTAGSQAHEPGVAGAAALALLKLAAELAAAAHASS